MNRNRRPFVPDPYDLNPSKRYHEKSRTSNYTAQQQRATKIKEPEYLENPLDNVDSEDEETYLQKDKHGKMSNYFRSPTKSSETPKAHSAKLEAADDTKERLTRLETMLEQLVKQQKEVPPATPPPAAKKVDVFVPPPKDKNAVEFILEPRNHHFTTSMWITKIQEISVRNNYTEKATIQFMEKQMTGIIKAWYKSLPTYDFSWPEWKLLITKTFPDNDDFIITLKRLVTRIKQSNETMTNYYYSKMYLIEACKITGEDAVSCLIDGLNNQSIQAEAKAQNYLTPETLCSQYLMTLPDYQVDYSPQDSFQPPPVENTAQYYYPSTLPQMDNPREPLNIHHHQQQQPQQQQPQPPQTNPQQHATAFDYPTAMNELPMAAASFNNFTNNNMHFEPALNQPAVDYDERPPVHSRLGGKSGPPSNRHNNNNKRSRPSFKQSKPMNRRLV